MKNTGIGESTAISDLDLLLRHLLNNPLLRAAMDSSGRLRTVIDTFTVNLSSPSMANAFQNAGPLSVSTGALYPLAVLPGPVDQRWEILQRSNLEYDCQRQKMTFS